VRRPRLPYKQALAWLYSLQRFGIKAGLKNIRRLLDELIKGAAASSRRGRSGDRPSWKVIHVRRHKWQRPPLRHDRFRFCRAQGYRTGVFHFPHLVTFRERIRVNGEIVSRTRLPMLDAIRNLVADWHPHPTFFEITTALALKCFSEATSTWLFLKTE